MLMHRLKRRLAPVLEEPAKAIIEERSRPVTMIYTIYTKPELIPEEDLIAVRLSLLRYWIKQGLSRDDAEDLIQAGILRGLMNLDKFKGQSSIKTWLIAVAKNEGYTYL